MSNCEQKCGFCARGIEVEETCGRLRVGGGIAAHQKCMQYSALLIQYKFDSFGGFKIEKVKEELKRGTMVPCRICKKAKKSNKKSQVVRLTGATCGCAVKACRSSFHFYCAAKDPTVITKRIETTNNNKKVVKYRVFCGEEHQNFYEQHDETQQMGYVSNSDPEGETNDDDDEAYNRQSSCENRPVMPVSPQLSLPVSKPQSNGKSKTTRDASTSSSSSPGTPRSNNAGRPKTVRGLSRRSSSSYSDRKRTLGTVTPLQQSNTAEAAAHKASTKVHQPSMSDGSGDACPSKRSKLSSSASANTTMDSSIDENKLRIQANPEDCVICFFEQCGEEEGGDVSDTMQQMARELYGVSHSAVYIWKYSSDRNDDTLTPKHMLYLLKDISQALSQRNVAQLERLVFDLSDTDISIYDKLVSSHQDLSTELESKIIEEVRKQIDTYFLQAEGLLKEDVGCVKHVASVGGNVMFLRVCHVIDLGHVIRSRLGHQADLLMWNESTSLANFSSDGLDHFQSQERETLLKWLGKHVNTPQILSWPNEKMFLKKNIHSTTYQLKKSYQKPSTSQSNNVLVFLGPVDLHMINFDVYVREMLLQLINERLNTHSQLFCVLDVGGATGVLRYDDLIPQDVPPHVDLSVWSAQNPLKLPVSAVLVKITFKTDSTPMTLPVPDVAS